MKKLIFISAIIVLVAIFAVLIFRDEDKETHESSVKEATDDPISVVASFYPLAFLTEEIGGEYVAVRDLAGTHEVHEYSPSPQDVIALSNSDVVLYLGMGIEPWVSDMQETFSAKGVHAIEVASFVLSDEEMHEAEGHIHEHEEDHTHDGVNPHIWLDPVFMMSMVDGIALELSAIDPNHADAYANNAESLKSNFSALNKQYAAALQTCDRGEVIVSHNAFERLADRYGFTTYAIAGISTLDEPSAATLAALKMEAAEGITHILTEQAATARFAETLSYETGLKLLTVNTLEYDPLDDKNYFDIMKENLTVFTTALGCRISEQQVTSNEQ